MATDLPGQSTATDPSQDVDPALTSFRHARPVAGLCDRLPATLPTSLAGAGAKLTESPDTVASLPGADREMASCSVILATTEMFRLTVHTSTNAKLLTDAEAFCAKEMGIEKDESITLGSPAHIGRTTVASGACAVRGDTAVLLTGPELATDEALTSSVEAAFAAVS